MNEMLEKFATVWPEISLLIGATVCLITGLSADAAVRRATVWIAVIALLCAGLLAPDYESRHHGVFALLQLAPFLKMAVVAVGLIIVLVAAGVPDTLRQTQQAESAGTFEPGDCLRGEFFAFVLFSLAGVMLTAGADDLVWMFLALELTSLPTYVLVAIGRDKVQAQESAVKYFFLGALSTAIFLYGFTLIYGATGFTNLQQITTHVSQHGTSNLFLLGLVLAITGICFKIAAVPMHFYAADVYEGAATPVTALLAFVPKTAGFAALILLLKTVGWPLEETAESVQWLLWVIAALTMTVGNVLALLQQSIKRTLAYSSIAHSGYIILGLMAGPAQTGAAANSAIGNGIAAVIFYLVAYGFGTVGAFAVLACLRARGEEVDSYDDLSGLVKQHPALATIMVICVLSLLGMPPLVGFLGKIYLFGSAINAGFIWLVVIAVINSAISAVYYLHIASACIFGEPSDEVQVPPAPARQSGAALAAIAALALGFVGGGLVNTAKDATTELHAAPNPAPADAHADAAERR